MRARKDQARNRSRKESNRTDLLNAPPQTIDPEIHGQPMEAIQHRHQLEAACLLHLRIRRPGANRALEIFNRDVLEAGIFHLFLDNSTAHEERHAHGLRGSFLILAPFRDVAVAGQGVVVGAGFDGDFLRLDPAIGLAVSVEGVNSGWEAGLEK